MKRKERPIHTVRILPLGDSLTQGDGSPSAYRYDLFRLLTEADVPFRFVGAYRSADPRMPEEFRAHSGRGGATTENLIAYFTEGSAQYDPAFPASAREAEVALLYIGTNDAHRGLPDEEYLDRVDRLLDILYGLSPSLIVYIATLRGKGELGEHRLRINRAILERDWVAYGEAHGGREVHPVDFNGRGTPRNLASDYPPDDGHPAADGNRKLAEMWFSAIRRRLYELCDTLPPDPVPAVAPVALTTNLAPVTVAPGQSVRFSAAVMPRTARIPSLVWQSSEPSVARVDEFGRVTGVAPGAATVTVRAIAGGFTRSATVTVAGECFDPMKGRRLLLSGVNARDFDDGCPAAFIEKPRAIRLRYPHWSGGHLEGRERFSAEEGFCLAFTSRFVTHAPMGKDNHLTVAFGGVSLTFSEGGRHLLLSVERGGSLAYLDEPPTFLPVRFHLVRTADRVTLYRDGEPLLDMPALPPRGKSALTLTWENYFGTHYLSELALGV